MKLSIDVENIRKGDTIRKEYKPDRGSVDRTAIAFEYVAKKDRHNWNDSAGDYFLLERPIVLPTEEGYYESDIYPLIKGCEPYRLTADGKWETARGSAVDRERLGKLMPLRKMGTERDIANKVLDAVVFENNKSTATYSDDIDTVRERYTK